jgi:hypothetical protein
MRHLLVFVDSERPDAYLNSVVHNLRSGPVDVVTFVHVYGFPGAVPSPLAAGLAKRMLTSVVCSIASLAHRAEYLSPDGTVVTLDLSNGSVSSDQIKAFYGPVDGMRVDYQAREIHYSKLRSFLRDVGRGGGEQSVDVTGCKKRFIGDFVALGLVDGLEEIRTFDLLIPTNFEKPWKTLLHELVQDASRAFEYVDILETRIMIDCSRAVFVRAPRLRYASAFAVLLALLGVVLNWFFGLDSIQAKWVNVLAEFATFAALFFVFFPPRNA